MISSRYCKVALALIVAGHGLTATPASDPRPRDDLDEVVVVGRFPGPPLWKISRDGHVLWILPLVEMYPKEMDWDSSRVETLVGESQEFIARPGVASGVFTANPLLLVRVLSLYNTMEHLPGNKTLADVLPPDLYQRFLALKSRYFPTNSGIERRTVSAVARVMQEEILEQEKLTWPRLITEKTNKWLKDNEAIRHTRTGVTTYHKLTAKELKALVKAIKEVAATPTFVQAEVACFEKVLAYFESDLEPVKRRANAWAQGSIDDLVSPTPLYSVRSACLDPFSATADFPAMRKLVESHPGLAAPDLAELEANSRQQWLAAAELALSRNTTTFALLAVDDVLDKDGLVAQLEARGYKVEISAR